MTDDRQDGGSSGAAVDGRRRARLVAAARRRPVRSLLAVTAALSFVLFLFPGIDLWITGLFHGGPGEAQFPATEVGFLRDLRELGTETMRILVIAVIVSLLGPFLLSGQRILFPPRAAVFLAMGLVLGPGLLVNVLLKGFWGRARPVQVIDFGGDHPFSAPWVIAGNCDWNCSFVSGEASSSIFLIALALVGPRAWRTAVAATAVAFSAVMSLNRIAFGGHFFSDVVLAWMLTLLVILIAHRIVYAPTSPFTDERIAGALGAAGDRTRQLAGAVGRRFAGGLQRFASRFR